MGDRFLPAIVTNKHVVKGAVRGLFLMTIADENGYTTKDGTTHLGATRVLLLGVLYAGPQFTATGEIVVTNVPTFTQPLAVSRIPMNLGMVIKANKFLDFEELLKQ